MTDASASPASPQSPATSGTAGPGAAARKARVSTLARGTLGRQLVVRVVALIAVVAAALSLLSLITVGITMLRALDHDVADNAQRDFSFNRSLQNSPRDAAGQRFNRQIGSLSVTLDNAGNVQAIYVGRTYNPSGDEVIEPEDVNVLLALPRDNQMHVVRLPHYGTYRVYSGTRPPTNADTLDAPAPTTRRTTTTPTIGPAVAIVSGLPMESMLDQLGSMAVGELAFTLAAIILAVLVIQALVRRSLRPLNALADTARAVSSMELDRGAVDLDRRARVDERFPDNEVTRVGLAFNRMLDHVGEALNAREASETRVRKFVADASHELRNPLAAIRGYAEITRRQRDEVPADTAFAMSRIESESERMSSLVEDMLLLARLDNNRALELSDVDLTEQLIHAVSDARVAGPDHVWELELPDEPVELRADSRRLYQVVVNLLTNARVHTPAGTTVTTSLRRDAHNARICVRDDGPGIPPEIQGKLFDRFVRADASRVRQTESSTGLGLAIVKAVVVGHGGTVAVDSDATGTVFTITLPLSGPTPSAQETYSGA